MAYSLYLSLTNASTQSLFIIFKGLTNYVNILSDAEVWLSVKNTFIFVLLSVPANIIFALILAMLLNAKVKGKVFFRTVFYLPTLVTIVAVALLWKQIFNYQNGILNSFLGIFGIQGPAWLTDYFWATPSLVIMGMWSVGGVVIIFLASLTDVPVSLYEACDIDGASSWVKFIHMTLPLMSPIIYFNVITATFSAFQVFVQPMLMTGGNYNTEYLGLAIFNTAFSLGRQGYASAMSWLLLLLLLLITGILKIIQKKLVFYND